MAKSRVEGLPERTAQCDWTTISGIPLKASYGAMDVPADTAGAIGSDPGQVPYLRGAHALGYRSKPWRIFQLSGFGNPEDEAQRIRYLLSRGGTGFIMEHDRMTADNLYDVDHPEVVARHEDVGISGAVIMSVEDCELALEGIDQASNYAHAGGGVAQHAPFAMAAYWNVALRRGLQLDQLHGTGQADFFLTYIGCPPLHQIPPRAALKTNCDIVEFCDANLPHWVPISMAGYNAADSGLNAYQELAALFACNMAHLDEIQRRGSVPLNKLAYALGGVSFRMGMDFFEEICKIRAARRLWHDLLRNRYGITDERALRLRVHIVTAGSAMTYQEPMNNVVRGTVMGLSAVLAGVQSMGVSAYDEALSVPSEQAHQQSVRLQQILMHETNLTAVADPLGGSYYVETLTNELLERAYDFLGTIDANGGFIGALENGFLQGVASENQVALESQLYEGVRGVVGVNLFPSEGDPFGIDGFEGTSDAWERGMSRLDKHRAVRDRAACSRAIELLRGTCRTNGNVMEGVMHAVGEGVTLGEVGDVFREAYGAWDFPVRF